MNWVAACSARGCNAVDPATVILPDTPLLLLLLLPGAGLGWEAHPAKSMPPAKTHDKVHINPRLPNTHKTPPKIFKILTPPSWYKRNIKEILR
jgi:hypothetical protein